MLSASETHVSAQFRNPAGTNFIHGIRIGIFFFSIIIYCCLLLLFIVVISCRGAGGFVADMDRYVRCNNH